VASVDLADLLRRYQSYDPVTGHFDQARTLRQYASLLGTDAGTLSRCFNGKQPVNLRILRALIRTFPAAGIDVSRALMADRVPA
jgi:dipeptidase